MENLEAVFDIAADLATYHNITDSKTFARPQDLGFPEGLAAEEYMGLLMEKLKKEGIDLNKAIQGQPQQQKGQKGNGQKGPQDPNQQPQDGEGDGEGDQQGQGQPQDGGGSDAMDRQNNLMKALGLGNKQGQDHSQWHEVPLQDQEESKRVMLDALTKARGDLPAGLKRLLKHLTGPTQVPWYERLRKLVGNTLAGVKKRYTMKRPSRRFGWPFPGQVRNKRGNLYAYLDTSGSMDDTEIAIAVHEMHGIAKALGTQFYLIQADADISAVDRIISRDDIQKLKIKGGGGTSSIPVFKYLEDKKCDMLVAFTDLYTVFPNEKPQYPVIWVTTNKTDKVPFGETIIIKRKGSRDDE
jgi:predicted metal-dependent peptidase